MLVEARDVEDSEEDLPVRKAPRSHLRVRSGLDEEYSADEIEKMTLLYEGTLSNIEEGEIVKSKVLRVTDTAVILDVGFKSEGAVAIDEFNTVKQQVNLEVLRLMEGMGLAIAGSSTTITVMNPGPPDPATGRMAGGQ
jgi:hypothetical protein